MPAMSDGISRYKAKQRYIKRIKERALIGASFCLAALFTYIVMAF